jgi:hypothetical protein
MAQTYKAILRGDRLEWAGEAPEDYNAEQGIEVYVTILHERSVPARTTSDGKAMADTLKRLAATGALSDISDPSTWQRDQRQDRVLPGRDN